MLSRLIEFSLRNSAVVLMIAAAVVGYALWRLPRMSVDVFPELNAPTITIMVESGGLAADEVEQYVAFPIETAIHGLEGVRRVRSSSTMGLSIVWVDLEWGADLYRARQLVSERLAIARTALPPNLHPMITPVNSVAGEVMLIALSSPGGSVSPLELRSYAEFELRNRLLSVPGVAQVVAIGGELPEYQVHVDQVLLAAEGLSLDDVVRAVEASHSTVSAGYLPDVESRELPLRQQSRVGSAKDIADTLVAHRGGRAVTVGQVATVAVGAAPRRGTASEGGHPAVILSIQKSPGVNTLELTATLDRVLDQWEPTLPRGVALNRDVMRQSHFIRRAVDNVLGVLVEAIAIVAAVLLLFLMNLRATAITLTAIPISLACGLLALDYLDLGLNVMTLGGLAIAIGVLVDDAIIDVENVLRRIKQNALLPDVERRSAIRVILSASNEIRPAMVFATAIILLVFVPLLFLQGLEGRFFRPLALTYIVAILASLVVALTVVPALCRYLLRTSAGSSAAAADGAFVRWLKRGYEPILRAALGARAWVGLGVGAAMLAALALFSTFGTSFLPQFNEGSFTVFLMAPPGTSLAESDRVAGHLERQLIEIEGVRSVSRRTGRAERDEHAEPVSSSEIDVTLDVDASRQHVRDELDRVLASVPGMNTMVGQPIEHRLSHLLSGTPAAVAINIFGAELADLRRVAKEVEQELRSIPGVRDVNANREVMLTTVPIHYRHADLAAAGLTPHSAAAQVHTALSGKQVQRIHQGTRQYDLVVRLQPEARDSVQDVRDLMLQGAGGTMVRLSDVADVRLEQTSNLIARENAQRKAVVSLNLEDGVSLGGIVELIRARVDPILARSGMTATYGGQFEAQQTAMRTIAVSGVLVAVVMLVLLFLCTGTLRASLLVLLNVPLALIGGVVAIFFAEAQEPLTNALALFGWGGQYVPPVVSVASTVGFITLFGIAVRNGVLLVNHYRHLMEEERLPLARAVLQGSSERLVPILMTAVSAALGLAPLALAAGEPGSELLAPLAVVTLGGLLTSTLLNLVVVPVGYSIVFSRAPTPAAHVDATPHAAVVP